MKKIKSLFFARIGKLSQGTISHYSKLPYTKIVLCYSGQKDIERYKTPKKVVIEHVTNMRELRAKIKEYYQSHYEYRFIPYFTGDAYSKYALYGYNLSFGNTIDPRIFKEKDLMSKFLGEISSKKNTKVDYATLSRSSYEEIATDIGETFIVKPTNASSSTSTFKIKSAQEYQDILQKLSKSYQYVIEEYIGGSLFSLDFYMDGENMYMLCLAREVAMIDLIEEKKFSKDFLEKYGEELEKHFNFVLPIRYNIDFFKISKTEMQFFTKIKNKLKEVSYRGFVHLEYKYDRKNNSLGFIEWGARPGGNRSYYIKKIYNTDIKKIPYYLLVEKDTSRFIQKEKGIFMFKEQESGMNLVGIKTNFIAPVHYIDILKKSGDLLTVSFESFLKEYFYKNFGIKIKEITFHVSTNKYKNFLPFYQSNNTKFDYILELGDNNYTLFRKKKIKIIEKTFFHDYK